MLMVTENGIMYGIPRRFSQPCFAYKKAGRSELKAASLARRTKCVEKILGKLPLISSFQIR